MKKRMFIVFLVLITLAVSGSLYAASSSSIGLVNYATWGDFEESNSDMYKPGIRAELFLSDYLGISADALVWYSDADLELYWMIYFIDAVFRLPLGMVEPYVAIGPGYTQIIVGDESSDVEDTGAMNIRFGADVNILDWLSIGAELNFLETDVEEFFNNLGDMTEEDIRENSLIGIVAKMKF